MPFIYFDFSLLLCNFRTRNKTRNSHIYLMKIRDNFPLSARSIHTCEPCSNIYTHHAVSDKHDIFRIYSHVQMDSGYLTYRQYLYARRAYKFEHMRSANTWDESESMVQKFVLLLCQIFRIQYPMIVIKGVPKESPKAQSHFDFLSKKLFVLMGHFHCILKYRHGGRLLMEQHIPQVNRLGSTDLHARFW